MICLQFSLYYAGPDRVGIGSDWCRILQELLSYVYSLDQRFLLYPCDIDSCLCTDVEILWHQGKALELGWINNKLVHVYRILLFNRM